MVCPDGPGALISFASLMASSIYDGDMSSPVWNLVSLSTDSYEQFIETLGKFIYIADSAVCK
jgi:hypothetical protein